MEFPVDGITSGAVLVKNEHLELWGVTKHTLKEGLKFHKKRVVTYAILLVSFEFYKHQYLYNQESKAENGGIRLCAYCEKDDRHNA